MGFIYHIAYRADWERALRAGEYRVSTRGRTLDDEGFIHASTESQVSPVANANYAAEHDLVVLVIDEERLTHDVRYESVPDGDEPFPHIYGPLNVDAVVDTRRLEPDAGGHFVFPA